MYSTPKAAHFELCIGGQHVPDYDPNGIRIRWVAAELVMAAGIWNMFTLKPGDVGRIETILQNHPWPGGVTLKLNSIWYPAEAKPVSVG